MAKRVSAFIFGEKGYLINESDKFIFLSNRKKSIKWTKKGVNICYKLYLTNTLQKK